MNIHPAFVHFPIALLCVYAVIELVPLARFFPSIQWDSIRKFTLYVGSLFAVVTAITGLMAEELMGESNRVEAHETSAIITIVVFGALCLITYFWNGESNLKYWLTKILALLGFVMLFVVGALGANLVYGSDVDPIVRFVTGVLGVQ